MTRTLAAVAALTLALSGVAAAAPAAIAATDTTGTTATTATTASTPKAVNGTKVTKYLRTAIRQLPVRADAPAGYARTKFKLWNDVDGDCQNTRSEVLRQETRAPVTGACAVSTGKWVSQYDGVVRYQARYLDIDHLVPLAEAWRSGAHAWTANRRQAYANDQTEKRSLLAVTATTNRSKGDSDPADWMPQRGHCQYIRQWVVVKMRWNLSVDSAERATLIRFGNRCANVQLTTYRAVVKLVGGNSGGTGGGGTGGTGGTGGSGLDPRFSTCTEAKAHGYGPYYAGTDPEYAWYDDRDHDGIVCE